MNRHIYMAYAGASYLVFFLTFLYVIGFVEGIAVPKTINSGEPGPVLTSVAVNSFFLGLFAIQHTIMARPRFKAWWTRIIPAPVERATFVLIASLILVGMCYFWRPMPTSLWHVESPAVRAVLIGISLAGFGLVLYSSFLIDHFDLFGLRQVWLHFRGEEYHHKRFVTPALYRMVRNPLMLGFLIAFWSTPDMTHGRLLFAGLSTAYIFVGIQFEERDIAAILGDPYRKYRARTPMVIPGLKFGTAPPEGEAEEA